MSAADERRTFLILEHVANERVQQDVRFGPATERGYPPALWVSVLAEEVGEAAKAVNDGGALAALFEELVQVAAVAVAFAEVVLADMERKA